MWCYGYVERARDRVPLLNHAIEKMEPYVRSALEVADIYCEAAFSADPDRASVLPPSEPKKMESKLFRVPPTNDLLQLRQVQCDNSIVLRARRTGTRWLEQLEAFVDNLGPSDSGRDCARKNEIRKLGQCPSHSSFSSIISSEEFDDSSSELCLTTTEMIPRALVLPFVLQVQVMRVVIDKSSSLVSATATNCCGILHQGAILVARLSLHGAGKVASRIVGAPRLAAITNGVFKRFPSTTRRAIAYVIDEDCSGDLSNSTTLTLCCPHMMDGGTGSPTHQEAGCHTNDIK
jgi:hypothetical protein